MTEGNNNPMRRNSFFISENFKACKGTKNEEHKSILFYIMDKAWVCVD
jgi:hypothetical protein